MQHSMDRPLAWPLVLNGIPSRTLDSILSAVACLHEGGIAGHDVEEAIDKLMTAAASPSHMAIVHATTVLQEVLRTRGLLAD